MNTDINDLDELTLQSSYRSESQVSQTTKNSSPQGHKNLFRRDTNTKWTLRDLQERQNSMILELERLKRLEKDLKVQSTHSNSNHTLKLIDEGDDSQPPQTSPYANLPTQSNHTTTTTTTTTQHNGKHKAHFTPQSVNSVKTNSITKNDRSSSSLRSETTNPQKRGFLSFFSCFVTSLFICLYTHAQ